jgi:transposase
MEKQNTTFEQVIEKGCGIDVHKEMMMATIMGKGVKKTTKEFNTFTEDIVECRQWLEKEGIEHVAMESTVVYWKPIFNILSESLEIKLVNARHIKNVPGHKTRYQRQRMDMQIVVERLVKQQFYTPVINP